MPDHDPPRRELSAIQIATDALDLAAAVLKAKIRNLEIDEEATYATIAAMREALAPTPAAGGTADE